MSTTAVAATAARFGNEQSMHMHERMRVRDREKYSVETAFRTVYQHRNMRVGCTPFVMAAYLHQENLFYKIHRKLPQVYHQRTVNVLPTRLCMYALTCLWK